MDLNEEDLIATKLDNGTMTTEQLLEYWHIKHGVPKWEIDYIKEELKNGN